MGNVTFNSSRQGTSRTDVSNKVNLAGNSMQANSEKGKHIVQVNPAGNSMQANLENGKHIEQVHPAGNSMQAISEKVKHIEQSIEAINQNVADVSEIGTQMLNIVNSGTSLNTGTVKLSREDGEHLKQLIQRIITTNCNPDKTSSYTTNMQESKEKKKPVYILDTFCSNAERNFFQALGSELTERGISLQKIKVEDFNDAQHPKHCVLLVCNSATRSQCDLKPVMRTINKERRQLLCVIFLYCKDTPRKSKENYPEEFKPVASFLEMTFNTDKRLKGLKNEYNSEAFREISLLADSQKFECSTCSNPSSRMQSKDHPKTSMQSEAHPTTSMHPITPVLFEEHPTTSVQTEGHPITSMQFERHPTTSMQSGTENVEQVQSAKEDSINNQPFLLISFDDYSTV